MKKTINNKLSVIVAVVLMTISMNSNAAMIVEDIGLLAKSASDWIEQKAQWVVEGARWADQKAQWLLEEAQRRIHTGAIIDANEAVGDKIIKGNEQVAQANADVLREQQLTADIYAAALRNQPTLAQCRQISSKEAAKQATRSGGGGGARVAGAIYKSMENIVNNEDNANMTLNQTAATPSLCSELDVARSKTRKNNCAAIGDKADANTKAGSIFAAAGTGTTAVTDKDGKVKDPTKAAPSWTMTAEDEKIARDSIKIGMSSDPPPSRLSVGAESTGPGLIYQSMYKTYAVRMSNSQEAKVNILSKSLSVGISDFAKKYWATQEVYFNEIWGTTRVFKNTMPTINERLNLEVQKSMTTEYTTELNKKTLDQSVKELVNRVNLNNEIQLLSLRQLESLTSVNASLLEQSIDPVKREKLDDLRTKSGAMQK
jgi:hypothetical protein